MMAVLLNCRSFTILNFNQNAVAFHEHMRGQPTVCGIKFQFVLPTNCFIYFFKQWNAEILNKPKHTVNCPQMRLPKV